MRRRVCACCLLLAALLATPMPARGAAIGQQPPGRPLRHAHADPATPQPGVPLLDVDELVALDAGKRVAATAAVPAPAPPAQPSPGNDFSSLLEEVFKSILNESTDGGQPTTQRPRQPPGLDTVSQKPPLESTGSTTKIEDFLPHLEEVLKGVLVDHKPADTKLPPTVRPLLPQTPKVPDTEEDLKHILPTLEEAIGSILNNSEAKTPATTSQPGLLPVHLTTTASRRPLQSEAEEDLKQILPTLEEAIDSILKNSEAKIPVTTSQPELPTVNLATTARPSHSGAEEDLREILPTLEKELGSILKNSESAAPTTTSRPVAVLPPISPATTDSRKEFAAVLPQLEEAIQTVLDEAAREEEAAAQQHTSPAPTRQPIPLTTKDYGFGKFLPELERVAGEILLNHETGLGAHTVPNTTVPTSTVKSPALPVVAPTEEKPSLQSNVIEADSLSSHSEPLLQAVKSTLQDVFDSQKFENKTVRAKP